MTHSLPGGPSLEQLKKQAKDILKAHKSGNESACETLKLLTKFSGNSDQAILSAAVSLQEVQHALAMSYGFDNWQALRQGVSEMGSLPEEDVDQGLQLFGPGGIEDLIGTPFDHVRVLKSKRIGYQWHVDVRWSRLSKILLHQLLMDFKHLITGRICTDSNPVHVRVAEHFKTGEILD